MSLPDSGPRPKQRSFGIVADPDGKDHFVEGRSPTTVCGRPIPKNWLVMRGIVDATYTSEDGPCDECKRAAQESESVPDPDVVAIRTALGFLVSAVRCGERWGDDHERIKDEAIAALASVMQRLRSSSVSSTTSGTPDNVEYEARIEAMRLKIVALEQSDASNLERFVKVVRERNEARAALTSGTPLTYLLTAPLNRPDSTIAEDILARVAEMRLNNRLTFSLCWDPEELESLAMYAIEAENDLQRLRSGSSSGEPDDDSTITTEIRERGGVLLHVTDADNICAERAGLYGLGDTVEEALTNLHERPHASTPAGEFCSKCGHALSLHRVSTLGAMTVACAGFAQETPAAHKVPDLHIKSGGRRTRCGLVCKHVFFRQ